MMLWHRKLVIRTLSCCRKIVEIGLVALDEVRQEHLETREH